MSYHTNEELLAEVTRYAQGAGTRACVEAAGTTVEGRSILAVRVAAPGRTPDVQRPQALVLGNIHGNEVIGSELGLDIVRELCAAEAEPAAQALLDLADVTVVAAINLDARARTVATLCHGRWARAPRTNAHGVDLNRNFPFPQGARDVWHPLAGSRFPWMPWYRGTGAFSEPESQAVRTLAEALRPAAAVNLHSAGELFLYPYAYRADAPRDRPAFVAMGRAFAAGQGRHPYTVKQSRAWYAILGDVDDWLYDAFGTLSVTIELSRLFAGLASHPWRLCAPAWWMNPPDPAPTLARATTACLCALAEGIRQRTAAG
jgi:predicted deacylase